MTNEAIARVVETRDHTDKTLNIQFKQRSTLSGLFIRGTDYSELQSKNFWRIVTKDHIEQWKKTKDMNLTRIFNGMEFKKISEK